MTGSSGEFKPTPTQADWLHRLRSRDRMRYGAPGIPKRTADVLIRLGLARKELQRVFRKHESSHSAYFLVACPVMENPIAPVDGVG